MLRAMTVLALVTLAPQAWSADSAATRSGPVDPDEAVAAFRSDLMAKRSDVMAKGLTLTSEQAAKFWPLFDEFQKEQARTVDDQIKATQHYGEHIADLSDADALAYINALLDRDAKVHDLRVKWLAKFQQVVPPKIAARAIQLDRRLGLVSQVGLSSKIPLIR